MLHFMHLGEHSDSPTAGLPPVIAEASGVPASAVGLAKGSSATTNGKPSTVRSVRSVELTVSACYWPFYDGSNTKWISVPVGTECSSTSRLLPAFSCCRLLNHPPRSSSTRRAYSPWLFARPRRRLLAWETWYATCKRNTPCDFKADWPDRFDLPGVRGATHSTTHLMTFEPRYSGGPSASAMSCTWSCSWPACASSIRPMPADDRWCLLLTCYSALQAVFISLDLTRGTRLNLRLSDSSVASFAKPCSADCFIPGWLTDTGKAPDPYDDIQR